ncbi:MAG: hypothetical protein KatS3mg087_1513 [Patescibacteria group bacterium]|nr:MAG: hypothetical protein KatS3mg087_1513 [Patescibacteria group bacterium]
MSIVIFFSAECSSKGFHSVEIEIAGWRKWKVIHSPCEKQYGKLFAQMNGCLNIKETINNIEKITADLFTMHYRAQLNKEENNLLIEYVLDAIRQAEQDIQERKTFWWRINMRDSVSLFISSAIKEENHILALIQVLEETDFHNIPYVEYAIVGGRNPEQYGLAAIAQRTKHPAIAQLAKKKIISIIQKTKKLERIQDSPYAIILPYYPETIYEIATEAQPYLRQTTTNEIIEKLEEVQSK